MCSSLAVGLGDESEQGAAAGRLDKTLFSSGVTAIIHLAFVEQRETTAAWLDRLQGELKADVELAGVSGFVQKLADVNARFGELLDKREEALRIASPHRGIFEIRFMASDDMAQLADTAASRFGEIRFGRRVPTGVSSRYGQWHPTTWLNWRTRLRRVSVRYGSGAVSPQGYLRDTVHGIRRHGPHITVGTNGANRWPGL